MKKNVTQAYFILCCINAAIWIALFVLDLCRGEENIIVLVLHGITAGLFLLAAILGLLSRKKQHRT